MSVNTTKKSTTSITQAMAGHLLNSISKISRVISTGKGSYKHRQKEILQVILDYLGAEQGSIMIKEKNSLIVTASTRKKLIGIKQPMSDKKSVASWVANTRKPLFIPDITADKRFPGRSDGNYRKQSLLSVPIIQSNKTVGVINVTDKAGPKDLFKEDINYLLEFSSLLLWLVIKENLHDDLRKQRSRLRKKNQDLRNKQAMMEDFSRMLIHDLKGPLSEVVANLDILSYSIRDENREFLESAQIGCDRAVRMVSNLVSINKIEDGRIRLIKEELSPASLLEEAVTGIKGLAANKGISIGKYIEPELPSMMADRVLVLRVLQNLLTNALSYSPSSSTISTSCSMKDGEICFTVSDEGQGIPEDQQDIVFDKYARLSSRHDSLVGTGLGLYFCKLAVEQHKGTIGLESTPPKGSVFYFTLPV